MNRLVKRSKKGLKVELFDFDTKKQIEQFDSITIAEQILKRSGLKKFLRSREMFLDTRSNKFVYLKEVFLND